MLSKVTVSKLNSMISGTVLVTVNAEFDFPTLVGNQPGRKVGGANQ